MMDLLTSLWRHSRLLAGSGGSRRMLLVGPARGCAAELRVAYRGSEPTLPFIITQLFESAGSTQTVALAENHRAHLWVEERSPLASLLFSPRHDLRLPAWISQQIDLCPGSDQGFHFSRHVRRETERHIRRHGYALDFSTDRAEMREFYHGMYLPYVRSRFDAQAIVVSESLFLQRAAAQRLARLHEGSSWVAGLLLAQKEHTLRFGWFGARSDPPPAGASEVLDVLVIRWAMEQRLRRVVLGHSRPCLRDGVLRYKRRLGAEARATRFPQPQIFMRLLNPADWLVENLNEAGFVRMSGGMPCVQRIGMADGGAAVRLEPVIHERH